MIITREQLRQALISIIVGACVAFLSTLFEGVITFLRDHAVDLSGTLVSMVYFLRSRKLT